MPTNGFADGILYSINGAPIFTYGMITITAVVLAYVTFIETPEMPNPLETPETTSISQVIPPAGMVYPIPSYPEMPSPLSISDESKKPVEEVYQDQGEPTFNQSPEEASPVEASPVEEEPVPKEKLPQGGRKKKTRNQSPKPKKKRTIKSH